MLCLSRVQGRKKGGIDWEYEGIKSVRANRKQGGIVTLAVGEERGGVPDRAATARNRPREIFDPRC
jgi:hypothetical protein